MKAITKTCAYCKQPFEALLREHKRGNAKYCSRICSNHGRKGHRQKETNVVCAYCTTPFYKNTSKRTNSKSGLYFCCRTHKDLAQRLGGIKEIQPRHYGDQAYSGYAYRRIAFETYPHQCHRCGYNAILEILEVHHRDRNHLNNEPVNLEILCPNCHATDHFQTRDGKWKNA